MFKTVIVATLILLLAATSAPALEVEGVMVPETLNLGQANLVLNGTGVRKKFGFRVYVGALYLKAASSDSRAIIEADEPMAITMVWKRNAPLDKVIDVFTETFKYAAPDPEAIKADKDTFFSTLPKAEKADVWKYQYLPGTGVQAFYNGTLAATLTDFNFKQALFSVWLLEDAAFTGDKDLRNGMLGK